MTQIRNGLVKKSSLEKEYKKRDEPHHEKSCFLHFENKGANAQLITDQHLCFPFIDSKIP